MRDDNRDLAAEICLLLKQSDANPVEGAAALATVLACSWLFEGYDKALALHAFGEVWDILAEDVPWKKRDGEVGHA